MEQFLNDNMYVIDLGELNTAPEIIFELSSILDKEEVKNKELWQELLELTKTHDVTFIKVKGHSDNEYNNRCDELARHAILNLDS